jgi:hypothetical protein
MSQSSLLPSDIPLPPSPPPLPDLPRFGPTSPTQLRRDEPDSQIEELENQARKSSFSTSTYPSSGSDDVSYDPNNGYRIKRELSSNLKGVASALEQLPPFSTMGCNASKVVERHSSRDHPLRNRKNNFSSSTVKTKKVNFKDFKVEEVPDEPSPPFESDSTKITSSESESPSQHKGIQFTLTDDGASSLKSLSSTDSVRMFRWFEENVFNSFKVVKFSNLKLTNFSTLNQQLVVLNCRLPVIFNDSRLNFLHHFHQTMYSLHLIDHRRISTYPKDDILYLIEKHLMSKHHANRCSTICPSAPMVFFCLRKTFSFERRVVKDNKFNFPSTVPEFSFSHETFLTMLRTLHDEFKNLHRATFSGIVPIPFE